MSSEAYSADMVTPPAELGPFGRLWSGFELVFYWLFSSGNLRAIRLSPTIAIGLVASGALLLLWYASLAVLVAAALHADPVQSRLSADIPPVQALLDRFLEATAWVETTAPYAFATLLLATFKTDDLAQMAQFTKDYLENQRRGGEPGLCDRVRRRVAETLERVLAEPYEETVVVGHCLGSVIAIDLLAGWTHPGDRAHLGLVTLIGTEGARPRPSSPVARAGSPPSAKRFSPMIPPSGTTSTARPTGSARRSRTTPSAGPARAIDWSSTPRSWRELRAERICSTTAIPSFSTYSLPPRSARLTLGRIPEIAATGRWSRPPIRV